MTGKVIVPMFSILMLSACLVGPRRGGGLEIVPILPMVVEIVDAEEKINAFLPILDDMMSGGLVTLEKARVIRYRAEPDKGGHL